MTATVSERDRAALVYTKRMLTYVGTDCPFS